MSNPYKKLDHIGIAVENLEEASQTYINVLGFKDHGQEILEKRGLAVRFLDGGNTHLELLAPLHEQSEISSFLTKRGPGIHHLCFQVDNLDKTVSDLKTQGVSLVETTSSEGARGKKVAFIHPKSAHGVLIELVEKT